MFYIDVKYLHLISSRLPRFKKINNDSWNCRCILCGDSKRNEKKARGYFYKSKESLAYTCHNCGRSLWFSIFLKELDPELYKEYRMENFKENLPVQPKKKEIPTEIKKETKICLLDDLMDRLDTLPKDNLAVEYCNKRKIPKEQFKNLYYVDDIRKVVQLNEKYKEHLTIEEPRLFIPFFNFDGSLVGATMRALRGEARRYINIKVKEDVPNIFGLLNVDKEKPLYVCEGPFDSMFLDNAIAVGGTSFGKIKDLSINFKKIIYIYDNQPYNKDLCKLISRQIEQGSNVVIWPNNIEQKDINEMCLKGKDVKSLVSSNVYSGLTAKMKFLQWRKC